MSHKMGINDSIENKNSLEDFILKTIFILREHYCCGAGAAGAGFSAGGLCAIVHYAQVD